MDIDMLQLLDLHVIQPRSGHFLNTAIADATRNLLTKNCGYSNNENIVQLVKSYPLTPLMTYDCLKHGPTSKVKFTHFAGLSLIQNHHLKGIQNYSKCHYYRTRLDSHVSIATANNHPMHHGKHYLSIEFEGCNDKLEGIQVGLMRHIDDNRWNERLGAELVDSFSIQKNQQELGSLVELQSNNAPYNPHCTQFEIKDDLLGNSILMATATSFGPHGRRYPKGGHSISTPRTVCQEVGIFIDLDNGSIYFYIEGALQEFCQKQPSGSLVAFVQMSNACLRKTDKFSPYSVVFNMTKFKYVSFI